MNKVIVFFAYLLTPETSAEMKTGRALYLDAFPLYRGTKTLLWILVSVLFSLLIAQLH